MTTRRSRAEQVAGERVLDATEVDERQHEEQELLNTKHEIDSKELRTLFKQTNL